MKVFPTIAFVDKIPEEVVAQLRNAHRYNDLGATYNFVTKHILVRRGTGQTRRSLFHEIGHWFLAIFTKSYKIHTVYDNFHLPPDRRMT